MSRVLVAMSGGVDSSVAAALVHERGDEAVGVTMKLLARAETGFGCCGSPADVDDAKRVAERLGIKHYVSDMAEVFADKVIRPYLDAYLGGSTPNPCVECNRSLKFGHLLALAEAWGCEKVATGHYARVKDGRLMKSLDPRKDQSYFLYSLTADALRKADFPVGNLSKDETRAKARELGLRTADKPESMETCFVPNRDVKGFVAAHAAADSAGLKPGPIKDTKGKPLGTHKGLAAYTVGQRSGVSGIAEAAYVVKLDPVENAVIVGGASETLSRKIRVERINFNGDDGLERAFRAEVRIRHRHVPAAATITPTGGAAATIDFDEPQKAPAPGQAAVFYDGEYVLGGGTITRGEP